MKLRISVLPAEYSDGMVRCFFNRPAVAETTATYRNVAQVASMVEELRDLWSGKADGQILMGIPQGRKVAGFDAYKSGYRRDVRISHADVA